MAYEFDGFWKDVGTLEAYWKANMELIDLVPEFNLYEPYWKIYTKNEIQPPQYLGPDSNIETCILGDGVEIEGQVYSSVIGSNVMVGKNTIIRDSIIMSGTIIKDNVVIERSIISEGCIIENNVVMGVGENIINVDFPKIYWSGLTVIGERTCIPEGVQIGKNCSLYGNFTKAEFVENTLASGHNLLAKGGEL